MSPDDDVLVRSCLDSIKENIEQQAREYELLWAVDALETAHKQRTKLFQKIHEEHTKAMRETVAESDKGYYYKWVSTPDAVKLLHPDTVAECTDALTFACHDLGLHDLPIHLAWFEDCWCSSVEYRRRMLSKDEELFSGIGGLRGFISWPNVTENGRVAVSTNLSFSTARTVLHECRHVHQRLMHGPEIPTGALLNELERDADSWASEHYETIRSARFSGRAYDSSGSGV